MKKSPLQYRPALTDPEKSLMMQILIRNPVAFETARDFLTAESFGEYDIKYALLWSIVTDFHDEYGKLPDRTILLAELSRRLDDDPNLFIADEREDLEELIAQAFIAKDGDEDIATSETQAAWAKKALKDFLEEQLAQNLAVSAGKALDLAGLMEDAVQQAGQIASITQGVSTLVFPEGWDKDGGIHLTSTGISLLDLFLAGGHAPSEAYGLLGPYGSCKTTLAVMLAIEAARQAHGNRMAGGEDHELAVLVSYEADIKELRMRMVAYAAQVHRNSLEGMGTQGLLALSTSQDLRPYEKKRFAAALAAGKKVLGERGRVKRAQKWINEHLIVLDMTGNDATHPGAGGGYVSEIAGRIARELRSHGSHAKIRLVVVDYVGAMAKRHLAASNKDENALRHLVCGAPLAAKNQIASKYGCPVWLLHQLSGQANRKGPGAQLHHTDAAESKSFAENLDFAFVVGAVNAQGLCQINATKHRRTGQCPPAIIRVRGEMGRVEDTAGKYVLDPYTHSIQTKSDVDCLVTKK